MHLQNNLQSAKTILIYFAALHYKTLQISCKKIPIYQYQYLIIKSTIEQLTQPAMNEDQEQALKIQTSQSSVIKQGRKDNKSKSKRLGQQQKDTSIGLRHRDKRNAKKIFRILFIVFAFVLIFIFCVIVEDKAELGIKNNKEKMIDQGILQQQSKDSSIVEEDAKDNFGVLLEKASIPLSFLKYKQKNIGYHQYLNEERNGQINEGKKNQIVLIDQSRLKQIPNSYSQFNKHLQNPNIPMLNWKMNKYRTIQPVNSLSQYNLVIQRANGIYKDQTQLQQQDQINPYAMRQKIERKRRQRQAKQENKVQNILSSVKKNPYIDEQYANISRTDIIRAKKWRFFLMMKPQQTNFLSQEEHTYYQSKYNIDNYTELPFCLVIPTFNNNQRKRYLRNIVSVVMQNYTNYRFVIIDDGSTDGTGQTIERYLQNQQTKIPPQKYQIVIHKERHFAMPNLRWAAQHFCKPEQIFMIVDGDDQLLGRQVLKLFNSVFQEKKVWLMYTNFLSSLGKLGYSRPYHPKIIEENDYRNYTFVVSHLRAYYTKLFLNIKQEDLKDENGTYFTSANDMAICIPSLEQSHQRIAYVPELTYYYNINTGQNVHKDRLEEQRKNNLKIRAKKSYSALESLFPQLSV